MKVLLVTVGLLLVNWQVDARAIIAGSNELDADEEACISELNLNKEDILSVNTDDGFPENNEDYNKFMGCSAKRNGVLSENGDIYYNKIAEDMIKSVKKDSEMTSPMIKVYKQIVTVGMLNCQTQRPTGTTPGQTFLKTLNCIKREMEEAAKDL